MCGIEVVKLESINSTSNYAHERVLGQNTRFYPNRNSFDTFVKSDIRINPAKSNPIYQIDDTYLATIFPMLYITKYSNPGFLSEAAINNKNIKDAIGNKDIKVKIYPHNVSSEIYPHFIPTYKASFKIMQKSGESFTKNDYETMKKAALLHDVGKAYIPDSILNKKGKLNSSEREVVDKHAQLSYETLKSGGVKPEVLHIVKNHHTYSIENEPLVQIMQIADIWSALKENRPYKKSFSDKEALRILYERAENGDFEKKYIDALSA